MDNQETEQKKAESPIVSTVYHRPGIWGVAVVVILVAFAFALGSMSARHRAALTYSTFAGPGVERQLGGMMKGGIDDEQGTVRSGMMRGGRPGHNGLLGSLTAINGNTLTVKASGTEHTVTVASTTSFYKDGQIAKQSDLATGDVLVISGAPDSSGNIQATAIDIR